MIHWLNGGVTTVTPGPPRRCEIHLPLRYTTISTSTTAGRRESNPPLSHQAYANASWPSGHKYFF